MRAGLDFPHGTDSDTFRDITCPACGHTHELLEGQCSETSRYSVLVEFTCENGCDHYWEELIEADGPF